MALSADFSTDVESIHTRYRQGFVNRSRGTRDMGLLDQIITDAQNLVERIPAGSTVRASAEANLKLYQDERGLIAASQQGGQAVLDGWAALERAELVDLRYRRDFAGQDRTTRDGTLLQELADLAQGALDRSAAGGKLNNTLADARRPIESAVELYRREVAAIATSRSTLAAGRHAQVLATLANRVFGYYRNHFSGKARASRRIGLLRRMIRSLEGILSGMEAVRALGVTTPVHQDNVGKVQAQLQLYRTELSQVEAERGRTDLTRLAAMLGDEANQVFAAYRAEFANRKRSEVKATRLGELCEQLHEIVGAMDEVSARGGDSTNSRNQRIVLDTLKRYEREYQEVVKAQPAR